MGKKKGKHHGGLDYDGKRKLEKEICSSMFDSGTCRAKRPDLGDEDAGGGPSGEEGPRVGSDSHGNPSSSQIRPSNPPPTNFSGLGASSDSVPLSPKLTGGLNPGMPGGTGNGDAGLDPAKTRWSGSRRGALSFAQILRGSKRGFVSERLKFIPGVNGDCIRYRSEDFKEHDVWAATIIGAVMGPAISGRAIAAFISSSWNISKPKVFFKQSGILVIQFNSIEDLNWVLEHGPWSIGSSPLLLKQWVVGAPMDWSFFDSVPIWVRIPDIPPTFSSNCMLSTIGSGIGKPLCVDEFTASSDLVSFARMLVEVNVEQTRRKHVLLVNDKGVECKLKVIFEWRPWSCIKCLCFGHLDSSCPVTSMGSVPPGDGKSGSTGGAATHGISATNLSNGQNTVCQNSGAVNEQPISKNEGELGGDSSMDGTCSGAAVGGSSRLNSSPGSSATAPKSSVGIQTEMAKTSNGEGNGEAAEETVNPAADGVSNHEKSLACARMVASSWAAEAGIYANGDGELEINECKTPDDLMRWKVRGGVQKGAYLLRGRKARVSGDMKLSLTMDELFKVMSGIKEPRSGDGDAVYFNDESDNVEGGDSSSDDETYHPG